MSQPITVELEFLQRALGSGEGGDPQNVGVFPAALPDDFPLKLPPLPGLRVLGSVRSVAPRWSFGNAQLPAEQRMWRVFLDADAELPDTMSPFQTLYRSGGWEAARPFRQVFVEAEQSQWMAVHPARMQHLQIILRRQDRATQVWLNLQDTEKQAVEHLLGQAHLQFDHPQAPLPTLTLPGGWRARMQQGSGGPVHSQNYELLAPGTATDLWPHLLPQLTAQSWSLLYQDDEISVFRTQLGIGTLRLHLGEHTVSAQIVHVTNEEGGGHHLRTTASF